MSLTILHLADLHLDSPFKSLSSVSRRLSDDMKAATRQSFERLVSRALDLQVDAVIIAGDAFNATQPSVSGQLFFKAQLERLVAAHIAVFLAYGNHDYYRGPLLVDLPEQVQVFDEQVTTFSFTGASGEKALISGFSYHSSHIAANRSLTFPIKGQETFHLGVYHGQMASDSQDQAYAPFSLSDLNSRHYDYWALGHIHQSQLLQEKPPIAYSGSIQGLDPSELGLKGGLLVTLTQGQFAQVNPIYTSPIVWANLELPLKAGDDLNQLRDRLEAALPVAEAIQLVTLTWKVEEEASEALLDQLALEDSHLALSSPGIIIYRQQFYRMTRPSQISLDKDKQDLFEGLTRDGLPDQDLQTALEPLLKHKTIRLFQADLLDDRLLSEMSSQALETLKTLVGVSHEN